MSIPPAIEAGEVVWLRAGEAVASAARREAGVLARRAGLGEQRTGDLALAVTEAATNLQRHSTDGALVLRVVTAGPRTDVEVLSLDSGPGITDLGAALRDGSSTAGTLGIGLGTIQRLADTFAIHTVPGRGTGLYARFAGPPQPDIPDWDGLRVGGLTRPINGEAQCGDTWAVRETPSPDGPPYVLVMMCDGLGHGPLAARAADDARIAFRESTGTTPAEVLAAVHSRLRGTRGAAVAVARVDPGQQVVSLAGAGNIAGFVMGGRPRQPLMSTPGIVGHNISRPRTFEARMQPGDVLVLHSDGLSSRWQPADFPGLLQHEPALIAGQLLWQTATRRDDAGVVVVTYPS